MSDPTMSPEDLKRARAVLGISQAELARRLGLSRPNIARLESGETLPNGQLRYPVKPFVALAVEYLVVLHSAGPTSGSASR